MTITILISLTINDLWNLKMVLYFVLLLSLSLNILPLPIIFLKLMHSTLGMPSRDDILRVVCSIKLGHTQASDLFRKLNQQALVSYDHQPLYKALSDFGRLLRTIYILRYIDDPEIRASVEAVLANDELEILLPERSSAVKIIAG